MIEKTAQEMLLDLRDKKVAQSIIAKKIRVTQGTISNWLNKPDAMPRKKPMARLVAFHKDVMEKIDWRMK